MAAVGAMTVRMLTVNKALWDCMKLFSLIFHIILVEVIIIIIIIIII